MPDAEWLEWLKRVDNGQLKESLGVRVALKGLHTGNEAELQKEIDAIRAEMAYREFPAKPVNPWNGQ